MNVTSILLDDAASRFLLAIQRLRKGDPIQCAFTSWLCQQNDGAFSVQSLAEDAASRPAGDRTFVDVAVLGYAVNTGITSTSVISALKVGLDWVTGRSPTINGQPAGFCSNGFALLGMALGIKYVSDMAIADKAVKWFSSFAGSGIRARSVVEWHKCLFFAADHILGANALDSQNDGSPTADVRVALRGMGVLPQLASEASEVEETDALLLLRNPVQQPDDIRAPLSLTALNVILRQRPTINLARPTITGVVSLLSRTEAALRRWTWEEKPRTTSGTARKWSIDNEYHVQNLLWAILSPVFPDLQDEAYTEAFGPLHPRIDLGIPSLKLIIEVKFVRSSMKFARIVEEISSDSGVYLSRPAEYEHIIPFIWDDASRVQEHDLLRSGLVKLRGVVDAVVVSRPSAFH